MTPERCTYGYGPSRDLRDRGSTPFIRHPKDYGKKKIWQYLYPFRIICIYMHNVYVVIPYVIIKCIWATFGLPACGHIYLGFVWELEGWIYAKGIYICEKWGVQSVRRGHPRGQQQRRSAVKWIREISRMLTTQEEMWIAYTYINIYILCAITASDGVSVDSRAKEGRDGIY